MQPHNYIRPRRLATTITTVSSRELSQDLSRAKKAAMLSAR